MSKWYKKKSGIAVTLIGCVLIILGTIFFASLDQSKVSCKNSINATQTRKLWDENRKVIEKIHSIDGGFAAVKLDTITCENGAFMHIEYDTSRTRKEIEHILKESPLNSVPVQWQNV